MKRIVFPAPRTVAIEDVPVPAAGPGEIVVKVAVSGISAGTELSYYRGAPELRLAREEYTYPIRPGYEAVGTVVECGPGVSEFQPGERVVCLGYHAEYVAVQAGFAARLPAGLSDEVATLAVLAVTSMHAVRRAGLEYGDTVAVVGLGVVGLLAALQARLAGAGQVIGVDVRPARLERAQALGLAGALAGGGQAEAAILAATEGRGADAVIEAAGSPAAFAAALRYARERGRVVVLGYHTAPATFTPGEEFYFKELEIRATRAIGPNPGLPPAYVRWTSDRSLRLAVELLASGRLNPAGLITHRFPAGQAAQAYQMIASGREEFLQVLLTWGESV